jgi:hypothetical protein
MERRRPTSADQNWLKITTVSLGPTSFTPDGGFDLHRPLVTALARWRDYHDHYMVSRSSRSPGRGLSPFSCIDGTGRGLHLQCTQGIWPDDYMNCLLFVATGLTESTFGYKWRGWERWSSTTSYEEEEDDDKDLEMALILILNRDWRRPRQGSQFGRVCINRNRAEGHDPIIISTKDPMSDNDMLHHFAWYDHLRWEIHAREL